MTGPGKVSSSRRWRRVWSGGSCSRRCSWASRPSADSGGYIGIYYTSRNYFEEQKNAAVATLRSLWPKDDFVTTAAMSHSLAWTNWPLYTVGLVQRGYSDDDIRKIIGGNVMRVARETMVDQVAG